MDKDDDKPASRKGSPFLNTAQGAHYLGLSRKTLEKLRVVGGGPRFRRHRAHVVYHIKDLDIWSERQSYRTTHDPVSNSETPVDDGSDDGGGRSSIRPCLEVQHA
jgi:hypothetical protein